MRFVIFKKNVLILIVFFCMHKLSGQGVAINSEKNPPNVSAMLDISSANKGLLIPRLFLTGVNDAKTIQEPANALLVYNTNDDASVFSGGKGFYYNAGTEKETQWVKITIDDKVWLLNGNKDINVNTDFIGTTTEQDLVFKRGNLEGLRLGQGSTLFGGNYGDVIEDFIPGGSGIRFMWLPARYAFRAGSVSGSQWSAANVGYGSFAGGTNTTASGKSSVSIGNLNIASGDYAVALGNSDTASGYTSFAIGNSTKASAEYSVAMGYNTKSSGVASTSTGHGTSAKGNFSTAMGHNTTALKTAGVAMGSETSAKGEYATAMGFQIRQMVMPLWLLAIII